MVTVGVEQSYVWSVSQWVATRGGWVLSEPYVRYEALLDGGSAWTPESSTGDKG